MQRISGRVMPTVAKRLASYPPLEFGTVLGQPKLAIAAVEFEGRNVLIRRIEVMVSRFLLFDISDEAGAGQGRMFEVTAWSSMTQ